MATNVQELTMPDKSGQEMVTTTMMVTPQQAQAWLDAMPSQRRVRQNKIRSLTRQVMEGRWKLTPHGLVFDRDGMLIDGQHRCTVIAQTGRALAMRVTFNAPSETFLVLDGVCSPKTIDDALHHEGLAKGIAVLAAGPVRMVFREERGSSIWDSILHPSNEEAVETYRRHPGIALAAELAARVRLAPSRSNLGYFLYRGLEVDETIIRLFVDGLVTGEQLRAGDPALLLRNTWVQERAGRVARTASDDGIRIATAINSALRGKRMTSWRGVEFGKGKTPPIGK